jgi:hypothetical protein
MEYENKYLKYKIKYNNLKKIIGGFRLDDPYDTFLYNQVKTYLTNYETKFTDIITYINLIQYKLFYIYDHSSDFNKKIKVTKLLLQLPDDVIQRLPDDVIQRLPQDNVSGNIFNESDLIYYFIIF